MTVHHPLRRLLARICSAETMTRVVDPTLADMRWERGRSHWRGYAALARALALHVVTSAPRALGRIYADDAHAIPKAAGWSAAVALFFATLLSIPPLRASPALLRESPLWLVTCLLPQPLALTLPLALLIGIPVAFHRQALSGRIVRRTVGLLLVCAAATFVVVAWLMPAANQSYRVLVSRKIGMEIQGLKGANETGFSEISRDIARLKRYGGAERSVRRLTYNYQMRLSLAYSPLPLGLIALCVSASVAARRRPLVIGFLALGGYAGTIYPLMFWSEMLAAREPAVPAGVAAWLPQSCLSIVAVACLAARSRSDLFHRSSHDAQG